VLEGNRYERWHYFLRTQRPDLCGPA